MRRAWIARAARSAFFEFHANMQYEIRSLAREIEGANLSGLALAPTCERL